MRNQFCESAFLEQQCVWNIGHMYIHVCQVGCCVLQILSTSTTSFCVIVKLSDGGHNSWPKHVLVNKLIYNIHDVVLFRKWKLMLI